MTINTSDWPHSKPVRLLIPIWGFDWHNPGAPASRDQFVSRLVSWGAERGLTLAVSVPDLSRNGHRRPSDDPERRSQLTEFEHAEIDRYVNDPEAFLLALVPRTDPEIDDNALTSFVDARQGGLSSRTRIIVDDGQQSALALATRLTNRSVPVRILRGLTFMTLDDLLQLAFIEVTTMIVRTFWTDSDPLAVEPRNPSPAIVSPPDEEDLPPAAALPGWDDATGFDFSRPHPYLAFPEDVHSSAAPLPVDENVQFTVYRPHAVRTGIWYPMLAFAHLAERRIGAPDDEPSPIERVQALAAQALGDRASAYGSPVSDARGAIPKEGELTFVPQVSGVQFNPPRRTFQWLEDVHQEEFRLRATGRPNGGVVRGRLTVFLGVFILADVDLVLRIDESAPLPPSPTAGVLTGGPQGLVSPRGPALETAHASPYRKVFPSYSHRDSEIVQQAERLAAALGDTYLRDRTTIRSGEDWNDRLLELIDEADVFQLFWSSNSMRSAYVRREWEHAAALTRHNFIRPTYWEDPMPRSDDPMLPPDSLRPLHFHSLVLTPPRSPEPYVEVGNVEHFRSVDGNSEPGSPPGQPITGAGSEWLICSACGSANSNDSRFCETCGRLLALEAQGPSWQAPPSPTGPPAGAAPTFQTRPAYGQQAPWSEVDGEATPSKPRPLPMLPGAGPDPTSAKSYSALAILIAVLVVVIAAVVVALVVWT